MRWFRSEIEGENLTQPGPQLGMLQPERDRRFEKAEFVAAIEAPAVEAQPMKGLALVDQLAERVGQLDFTAAAGLGIGEVAKDFGLDDVAADNCQGRDRKST